MNNKNKKIMILIIIILIILILLCGGAIVYLMYNTPADKFSNYLNSGFEYLEDGDYDEAKEQFNNALDLQPNSVDAYLGIADAYFNQADIFAADDDIENAEKEYKEIIKILKKGYKITEDNKIDKKINEAKRLLSKLKDLREKEYKEPVEDNSMGEDLNSPATETTAAEESQSMDLYEAFLRGEIATTDGKFIDDYKDLSSPEDPIYYYYIQAKNVSDKAMVLSYANGASVANDVLYAHDGILEYKGYFGRQSIGGSGLVDETYIAYESMMADCNSDEFCEYYIIQKFTENYELVDEVYALKRAAGCSVMHGWDEYIDGETVSIAFREDLNYSNSNDYLANECGADTDKSYYDHVEWATIVE